MAKAITLAPLPVPAFSGEYGDRTEAYFCKTVAKWLVADPSTTNVFATGCFLSDAHKAITLWIITAPVPDVERLFRRYKLKVEPRTVLRLQTICEDLC
jgi:hypothetical protein